MSTELVLMEDVAGLGKIGETVKVADGYARNFLLPRKLAAKVTPGILKSLEAKKKRVDQERELQVGAARELAEKIGRLSGVSIAAQAGDDDKLYGSVAAHQILEALEKAGFALGKHAVVLPEPIKVLGTYTIELALHADVKSSVSVTVVRG